MNAPVSPPRQPLVSIVTAVLNGAEHLAHCIESVRDQDYPHVEHVVVDGGSQDGTLEVIEKNRDSLAKWVSEPDQGIYDGMNKGIRMAGGEIVGLLNADDFYPRKNVLSEVAATFQGASVDAVFGDLLVVDRHDAQRILRYYDSSGFHPGRFAQGWMPPHPTFFVLRKHYQGLGLYRTDYTIASDYELLIRFLARHRLSYARIPRVLVHMRSGGVSSRSIRSNWILNREILRACRENGIRTNMFRLLCKYPRKLLELVRRPALDA